MHREIMQPPKGMVVDHIDGSQANNCRFNLRVCTRAENQRRCRKHAGSISSFKGVFYNRRRKWFSQCWLAGKGRATPCVDEEVEAAQAYDRQAVEHFGEFARLNFPEEWPPERRTQIMPDPRNPLWLGRPDCRSETRATGYGEFRGRHTYFRLLGEGERGWCARHTLRCHPA
jgi:hypothetical protein